MAIETPQKLATIWEIDPAHSTIEFKAKHMMVTTVRGRFNGVTGQVMGDVNDPTQAKIDIEIDATTVDTRNDQRDGHLRSADFLDADNHPTITFTSTRIEPRGKDRFTVIGDLTIRGITREIELDTTLNGGGTTPYGVEVLGATSEGSFNRKDFGLTWNVALETGGWLVSDKVNIEIEAELTKKN